MTYEEAFAILRDTPIDIRIPWNCEIYPKYATAQSIALDCIAKQRWHLLSDEKPTEEKEYLCCNEDRFVGRPMFYILTWSNDLYKVDAFDFADKKGKAGFYIYDSEFGYIEWDCEFWKEIDWRDEE